MKTILTVFGTRPEAIKLAPVLLRLSRERDRIHSIVCVSGQHRAMLDQVLQLFGIKADHDFDLMRPDQSPAGVAAGVLLSLDSLLKRERPDWVLVQGDTTTAAAAAIAGFYGRVRVGHVEAGLRSFDRDQPFPEEINRRLAGVAADIHFAPTERSRQNLLREGVQQKQILVSGNTVIDALHLVSARGGRLPRELSGLAPETRLVLVTAHRRENLGLPLGQICAAVRRLAAEFRDGVRFVFPIHLNPNVRELVESELAGIEGVVLTEPLDYQEAVGVLRRCALVITDSGGLQEEAPALGVPVLVLRNVTERPEGIEAGTARLVGTDADVIVREASRLLSDPAEYARMSRAVNPYGDGNAAERIVATLLGDPVTPFESKTR